MHVHACVHVHSSAEMNFFEVKQKSMYLKEHKE